jgi:hypothetical protein
LDTVGFNANREQRVLNNKGTRKDGGEVQTREQAGLRGADTVIRKN